MKMSSVYIFAVFVGIIAISGCASQTKEIKFETLKGVSLSPSGNDFAGFFEKAKEAGSVVTWAGEWGQFVDNRSAPYVVQALSDQYGYKPVMITEIRDDEINSGLIRSRFRDLISGFVGKYKPSYIGLGNEVNIEYEASPALFVQKMEFYGTVYDSIKEVSPDTKVFTVFQLERLKGRKDGLFGGNITDSEWFLLGNTSKFDVIAFTTYPTLIYKDPSEIPDDYYKEIKMHTSKPIAFTEVGWFRSSIANWESDEYEQARFIRQFFLINTDNHPLFSIWPFLYDQKIPAPFETMGLISGNNTAFNAWVSA